MSQSVSPCASFIRATQLPVLVLAIGQPQPQPAMTDVALSAVHYIENDHNDTPHAKYILNAGRAMRKWIDLCNEENMFISKQRVQQLKDECCRYLSFAEKAAVDHPPKDHLFWHLTSRTGRAKGDETLFRGRPRGSAGFPGGPGGGWGRASCARGG